MSLLSRRRFAVSALSLLGSARLLGGCGTSTKDSSTPDSSIQDSASSEDTGNSSASEWATGGTASMSGDYPDPFESPSACEMVCAMTLGPCYAETEERQDISEGYTGLPTRLSLRILDTDCKPVEGMYVDIWHACISGLYSGSDASDMCTDGNSEMLAHRYFRGVQKTDSEGKVNFDTCFPGWYSGRAVHIHFQVRTGSKEGDGEYVTSQLFFSEEIIQEIYSDHPEYQGRGQPDTPNSSDKVLGANDPAPYTLEAARQKDGALLAWKTLVIRSSFSETLCTAPESGR